MNNQEFDCIGLPQKVWTPQEIDALPVFSWDLKEQFIPFMRRVEKHCVDAKTFVLANCTILEAVVPHLNNGDRVAFGYASAGWFNDQDQACDGVALSLIVNGEVTRAFVFCLGFDNKIIVKFTTVVGADHIKSLMIPPAGKAN